MCESCVKNVAHVFYLLPVWQGLDMRVNHQVPHFGAISCAIVLYWDIAVIPATRIHISSIYRDTTYSVCAYVKTLYLVVVFTLCSVVLWNRTTAHFKLASETLGKASPCMCALSRARARVRKLKA